MQRAAGEAPWQRPAEGVTVPASKLRAGSGYGDGDGGDPARIPAQRSARHTASATRCRQQRPVSCAPDTCGS